VLLRCFILLLRWTGVISTSRLSAYNRDHQASSELIFQWVNEKVWVVPPGHLQTLMILVKNWLSFQLRWLQLVANCMRVLPGQSSFSSTSWWTWPVVQRALPTMVPAQYWMSIQFQSQTGSVWHPHYPSLLVQPWLPPWRSSHCLKWSPRKSSPCSKSLEDSKECLSRDVRDNIQVYHSRHTACVEANPNFLGICDVICVDIQSSEVYSCVR